MSNRTAFPRVFWIANSVEIIERFAYYGIYLGFGIYAIKKLGFSKDQLGEIQSYFLAVSYLIPLFSGTLADKFGFKKLLIISYLAYIPSILFLLLANTFGEVTLTMLSIALAAGTFKPLISGTVRTVTDSSNKTLGFGIFYTMVNFGATFGPIVAGKLRAISWYYAFVLAAIGITCMLIITVFFYKEPERKPSDVTLGAKMLEIVEVLLNFRFSIFLILLGIFFWLPFWAFFNLGALYIDSYLDKALLYDKLHHVFGFITPLFGNNTDGVWKINGEAVANTGLIIIIFQVIISKIIEKRDAILSFSAGMFIAATGFLLLGLSLTGNPVLAFFGIILFAFGEMTSSPRIQEYIMWLAPKEKAGMYMGTSFLATFIGAFLSGFVYTKLLGIAEDPASAYHNTFCRIFNLPADAVAPQYVWYILTGHLILGIVIILAYIKIFGGFKERSE